MPHIHSLGATHTAQTPTSVRNLFQDRFFFTHDIDGASQQAWLDPDCTWGSCVWLVADSNSVEAWLTRAKKEMYAGKTVVALVPARTSTKYFHQILLQQTSELWFLQGRLRYKGQKNPAMFASVVAVFDGSPTTSAPLVHMNVFDFT